VSDAKYTIRKYVALIKISPPQKSGDILQKYLFVPRECAKYLIKAAIPKPIKCKQGERNQQHEEHAKSQSAEHGRKTKTMHAVSVSHHTKNLALGRFARRMNGNTNNTINPIAIPIPMSHLFFVDIMISFLYPDHNL